tara:strand:+ start:52 stop:1293 length:1242 start_codon:yes stop_codon:yes gene_type:complete
VTKENLIKKFEFENLLIYSFALFPLAFLIGNLFINFFLLLFSIIFVSGLFLKKFKFQNQNKFSLYLLLFFFFSLIINLIFSNNFYLTLPRVLKFILIIGSILCFSHTIINYRKKIFIKIYKFWSILFGIVLFDIIFELIFKFNIFGFSSIIPGRVVSFSNDEMNIGHFFLAFCLIFINFVHTNFKNIYLTSLLSIFFILISFLIGERSNFIKTFIIIVFFSFFAYEIKLKYKFLIIVIITAIVSLTLSLNENYKERYYNQFTGMLFNNGLNHYINYSLYGAHYKVAYEIFKDNPYFGVGIKNFRVESFSEKYDNLNHSYPERRGNTHPHQIHLEFLSETGLIGYACFMIFILVSIIFSLKNYIKNKNLFQLSSILYILVNLLPLIPSGSFFTTYSAGLFWLHYAIMIGYIRKT